MFWNGKPVQFFQERCWVVVTGCQENESCRKVLNFLERLDDRIRCTHEETVAVVKSWDDIGSNKSLGCVFSEKPVDWTNAFKLEISSLADFLWCPSSWTVLSQEWIQGSRLDYWSLSLCIQVIIVLVYPSYDNGPCLLYNRWILYSYIYVLYSWWWWWCPLL